MFFLFFLTVLTVTCTPEQVKETRSTEDFNFDWKFHLGDVKNGQEVNFTDTDWDSIKLPHDWSVEHAFTQKNTAGATAFLPGGIGWDHKTFNVPKEAKDKIISIEFDGVYSNSEVWINGNYLGKHPYGYTPFTYELTKHLKYGVDNHIAVKVDRSAYIDCRWYPGSGIYRHVKLVTKNKIHIPQWGVFVTTPKVSKDRATIAVQTDVVNQFSEGKEITIQSSIYDEDAKIISTQNTTKIAPGKSSKQIQELELMQPNLWGVNTPNLYTLVSEISINAKVVDRIETPFGIRSFTFDKDKGFFLNGEHTYLKGVCLHHDGGLVGSAVPKGVWKRRLMALKEAGCNAIRTAHNPPSQEFLDLCDQMGFLVQDEAFDEWNNPKDKKHNYAQKEADPLTKGYTEHFTEWSERDIKSMVMRDRNHPSIIMWSIGNEIEWTYPRYGNSPGYWGENKVGDVNYYWDEPPLSIDQIKENFKDAEKGTYDLTTTAQQLTTWVKDMDTTRPVTANLTIPSVSNFSGYADALDIVGLSYRQSVYNYVHRNYPQMTFLGTENWARYHEWKQVLDKKFISGIFIWTGIDYMGESRAWPIRGSGSGLLDFAGFKKPSYHMFKSLWLDEPHIYMTTQLLEISPYKMDMQTNQLVEKEEDWAAHKKWGWYPVNEHWNYKEGDTIAVEVYTNQPEVELFLNERSMGVRKLENQSDHVLKWSVPYKKGVLSAKAVKSNKAVSIKDAKEFKKISITADTLLLSANGYDVAHITVQLEDKDGVPIKQQEQEIVFQVDGDARILGVDNGGRNVVEKHQSNKVQTAKGKALLILQANKNTGEIQIKATSKGIESKIVRIKIE